MESCRVNILLIFLLVVINNDIPFVIEGLFQQPLEHPGGVFWVRDPGLCREPVKTSDIVPGDRTPVHLSGCLVCPAFDAGKEPFHSGAVALDLMQFPRGLRIVRAISFPVGP